MNQIIDYILRKRRHESNDEDFDFDMRRGDYPDGRRGVPGSGRRRSRRSRADEDYDDWDDYETDGRRGVKGTGSRRRRSYSSSDYDDEDELMEKLRLRKKDYKEWSRNLKNADGTHGPHFDHEKICEVVDAIGLRMHDYSEKDLCMTANMLYSDMCSEIDIPKEKELQKYIKMAKKWLDDEDAELTGAAKLAAYYYIIVCGGDF